MLKENDDDDDEMDSQTSPKAISVGFSRAGSNASKSVRSILGYTPIPQHLIEKNADYLVKWLNNNVLAENIT